MSIDSLALRSVLSVGSRILVAIVVGLLLNGQNGAATHVYAALPPTIGNVVPSATTIACFDKFQVQFDVTTVATNPAWPYDSNPPSGLPAGTGISIDGLFSHDGWQTTSVMPAFLYQPYTHTQRNGRDHFTPDGAPVWMVRFTPQESGVWQYRLRAHDAGGTTFDPTSGVYTLTVTGQSASVYRRHGFLRLSSTDRRYFEFQDGTPFIGVGLNHGFYIPADLNGEMQQFEDNGIDLVRIWQSSMGINGSHWFSWGWDGQPTWGYLPAVHFDVEHTYNGGDVSMKLDSSVPCLFADSWQGGIPVEPNTTYQVSARVRLNGVTGPTSSGDYGFVVKQAGWLTNTCEQINGTQITAAISGTTDWTVVSGTYTTGLSQFWLDYLYLARQNATAGEIYVDEVRLWRQDDPYQVNLLRHPNANSHYYFDPMNSAQWDRVIEAAEQHGVYLKVVVDEKNEWIRNQIDATGQSTGSATVDENGNFYAGPGLKVRWLEQAWWRYLIARWGYSTAIHSFEYINEGDPTDVHHYEAANAMAAYLHQNDTNRHLVTTSFWHSFPNAEFWSNSTYPDVDYTDLHAYISTGWPNGNASMLDATSSRIATNSVYVRTGNASGHLDATDSGSWAIAPTGMAIRGPGEWIIRYWMKAEAYVSQCGNDTGLQRVHWILDGGTRDGVVPPNSTGTTAACTSKAGTYDWTQFSSDRDRDGTLIPAAYRIILSDSHAHDIRLYAENWFGVSGDAWIDDVELVSPSGQVTPVIGQFDITAFDTDTAWSNRAYGAVYGATSPVGVTKPLVRGETGVDSASQQGVYDADLVKDTAGVWLHNNVWAQVNPAGMYDLFWYSSTALPSSIYYNYLTLHNFMQGVPLNNGHYADARAETSNANLRAWGQRDDVNGRAHLWVQNIQHTWRRVVNGPAIEPVSGTVTLRGIPSGIYRADWWHTYTTSNSVFLTQSLSTSGGLLVLTLPYALTDDLGVHLERTGSLPSYRVLLPFVGK